MTQVTVYKWDDVGAPQITSGSPTEYMNVLIKCLVEGYGTKQPVGWEVLENQADTPFLALHNNTQVGASGGKFILKAPDNGNYAYITVTSALEYTDKDNYSKVGRNYVFNSYSSGENLLKNWMVFATSYGFYFFAVTPSLSLNRLNRWRGSSFFYCGDLIPSIPNDPVPFVMLSGANNTSPNYDNGLQSRIQYSVSECCLTYGIDGVYTPVKGFIRSIFGTSTSTNSPVYLTENPPITMLHPLFIVRQSKDDYNNNSAPFCKGQVPGLYLSPQFGYAEQNLPFYKTLDSQEYFSVPSTEKAGTRMWLNTEVW
jgi:hypothetical protein